MTVRKIRQILKDTAYSRTGGSAEELKCAEYLVSKCAEMGLEARLFPFKVDMSDMHGASLTVDGKEVACRGYLCSGSGEIEGELYYLRNTDPHSLSQCRGKIVMIDGYPGYWMYHDLLENGAAGFITYDGDANYSDRDIDRRELRSYVSEGNKILGVNINAKDAIALIQSGAARAKIAIDQEEYEGESRDVILDMPGDIPETIVFTAHYDSTFLSQGAYDNMSGSIGLLGIAEYFTKHSHRHSLRFIWCGSEERGLLGSKAYAASLSEEELKTIVLNVNLDMIGSIMGRFIACCTSEDKLVHYIQYFAQELGFGIAVNQDVYSSDSTPFADKGVPAVSFARLAPHNTATIHNSYDTAKVMSAPQTAKDIDFICAFSDRMANAARCPVDREIPENIKKKLDYYLCREREKK